MSMRQIDTLSGPARRILCGLAAVTLLSLTVLTMAPRGADAQAGGDNAGVAVAIFAGGCFWCMEPPFDKLDGVLSTTSGYIGGRTANPTYREVSTGNTGHIEAVKIEFNPNKVSYDKLLQVFWRNIDPVDAGGQFCDRGERYTTAIFYLTEDQKRRAGDSLRRLDETKKLPAKVVTRIRPATEFYPAEEYHQDYYKKNPLKYKLYRQGCGRDRRLAELWGNAGS
jgi:methionine-S-sulfoxide reductase